MTTIQDRRERGAGQAADGMPGNDSAGAAIQDREPQLDQYGIDHFLRCYRSGNHGAASSGEQAAFQLGQALLKNIGAPSDLDCDCLNGFLDLVRVAHTGYDGMDAVKRMLMGRRAA